MFGFLNKTNEAMITAQKIVVNYLNNFYFFFLLIYVL